MILPYKRLSPEAIQSLIEQFVSRDGSDSGHADTPFNRKVETVKQMLESGKAVIVYDEETKSCNFVSQDDPVLTVYK